VSPPFAPDTIHRSLEENLMMSVTNLPSGVTCNPSTKTTSVTAGLTSILDFLCAQQAAFADSVLLTYRHFAGFSRVCGRILTTPAQPGAVYTGTFSGPPGGVQAPGTVSGNLDATGAANVFTDIALYGAYCLLANILGQTGGGTVNVTAAAGTGTC
jgi:hypothetical protein